MAERGSRLYRFLDRYIGIPLTVPAAIFRCFDRRVRKVKSTEVLKAAVICLGAIGDLLLLSGAARGLKKLYPNVETTLITSMDNRSAAALIEVERVYSLPISKFLRVIALLRRERYDLLIDSTQWARIGALISAFSGSGRTVGFKTKGEARSLAYDEVVLHSSLKHEWENFASLLQTEAGAFKPKLKECRETERRLLPDSNFVVLHMFASGSYAKNKEWREEYWKMLAEYLAEKGYIAIFTGSESDRERLEAFIDSLPKNDKFINSAGRLNLEELSVLLRRAEGVVSVNTGIMHLAALSGVFTIALHGPSDPARWGGIGDNVVNLTPQGVNSFPAMNGGKIKDESSFARNIKPEEVILALQQALKC